MKVKYLKIWSRRWWQGESPLIWVSLCPQLDHEILVSSKSYHCSNHVSRHFEAQVRNGQDSDSALPYQQGLSSCEKRWGLIRGMASPEGLAGKYEIEGRVLRVLSLCKTVGDREMVLMVRNDICSDISVASALCICLSSLSGYICNPIWRPLGSIG